MEIVYVFLGVVFVVGMATEDYVLNRICGTILLLSAIGLLVFNILS